MLEPLECRIDISINNRFVPIMVQLELPPSLESIREEGDISLLISFVYLLNMFKSRSYMLIRHYRIRNQRIYEKKIQ